MIPDLKDNRLVCDLCRGNLEVDSVVVGWVGRALHLVARLHLLIKVVIWEPWLSQQKLTLNVLGSSIVQT